MPYWKGISVYETTISKTAQFYRVHGPTNQLGGWLIDFDPSSYSALELRNMLALPRVPTQYSKVIVAPGAKVRVGVAGEIKVYGRGGTIQWEILTYDKDLTKLGVIFEKVGDLK